MEQKTTENKASFSLGTSARVGVIKIYFDIDENYKAICGKIARARVLYEAFCANPPSLEELGKMGDVT